MQRSRRIHRFRSPSQSENSKIYFTGFPLEELFDEDDLNDMLTVARHRVIGEFYFAHESYRGRLVSTDNYIIGIGNRLRDLAGYVTKKMHRHIVSLNDLPKTLHDLSPKLIERIITRTEYELVLLVLQTMLDYDVWHDEGLGIWQVNQSSIDEYLRIQAIARQQAKYDDRSYHGRVRSQSKARGIPEGTSIGTT